MTAAASWVGLAVVLPLAYSLLVGVLAVFLPAVGGTR